MFEFSNNTKFCLLESSNGKLLNESVFSYWNSVYSAIRKENSFKLIYSSDFGCCSLIHSARHPRSLNDLRDYIDTIGFYIAKEPVDFTGSNFKTKIFVNTKKVEFFID